MTTKPLSRSIPETLPHAHVVSKAHDLHILGHCHADGGLHPAADAGLHVIVLPVTGDDLARLAESGSDEAVLAVAVCGLIKVHEVHVDLFVGISRLYCVAKCSHGFCRRFRPLIHILDGLNVWHHVTMPAQESS